MTNESNAELSASTPSNRKVAPRCAVANRSEAAKSPSPPSSPITHDSSLSGDAARLLEYLERFAPRPDLARTDEVISNHLKISERSVIDLADDLMQVGHVIVANVGFPAGRWLLTKDAPDEYWLKARKYVVSLQERAVKIMARGKHARLALDAMELARQTQTNGQATLFGGNPIADAWSQR